MGHDVEVDPELLREQAKQLQSLADDLAAHGSSSEQLPDVHMQLFPFDLGLAYLDLTEKLRAEFKLASAQARRFEGIVLTSADRYEAADALVFHSTNKAHP